MHAYWTFSEDQLREALKEHHARRQAEAGELQAAIETAAISEFLSNSPEVRARKMRLEVA